MQTIFSSKFVTIYPRPFSSIPQTSATCPLFFKKFSLGTQYLSSISTSRNKLFRSKSSEEAEVSEAEDEWLQRLPDKKKALYSHSLPCIEAWLRSLGFHQNREDRAVWFVQKPDWHAQLSLDVTDLYISNAVRIKVEMYSHLIPKTASDRMILSKAGNWEMLDHTFMYALAYLKSL